MVKETWGYGRRGCRLKLGMHDEIRDEEEERRDMCDGRPGGVWCVTTTKYIMPERTSF
jgi:hypothetical protein